MPVEYRLLGPLEIVSDGHTFEVGGKQQALLATLLVHANRVVPVPTVIEALWGAAPPPTAHGTMQSHVMRLRRALRSAGSGQELLTRPGGYLIRTEPGQLDRDRFDLLVDRAGNAIAGQHQEDGLTWLREALGLWRGRPLQGVASELLQRTVAPELEERRLSAIELAIDTELALGRHATVVAELRVLVQQHPFRERLHELLMLALYRCGRQVEALQAYQNCRRTLVTKFPEGPGPRLRRLEQAILAADRSLDPAAASSTAGEPGTRRPPAQLPPDLPDFAGRDEELSRIVGTLSTGRSAAGLVIVGQPGVGKTSLALRAGHRLRDRYPDGQLFADLRGAGRDPLDASAVLAQFLRALGLRGIPDGLTDRAALFRSVTADRRLLVVLDNAAGENQVRPLMPGGWGCAAIVTSRVRLGGLDAVQVLHLAVLTADQAMRLLERIVGADRVRAEPEHADGIVRLCGLLPLAVRIAGARLAAKPHWSLGRLAHALADERVRLDELRAGDLEVRASLALSYEGLTEPERDAVRACARFRSVDPAAWLVAAVLGIDETGAAQRLERLVDGQLLRAVGPDDAGRLRYRLHDLTRVFATERCEELPPRRRRTTTARVLDACLALAEHAARRIEDDCPAGCRPVRQQPRPGSRRLSGSCAAIDADPFAWFDAERPTLVAAVEHAVEAGMADRAWRLAEAFGVFCEVRGYWDDWQRCHLRALEAVAGGRHRAGEAAMLCGLGQLALDRGYDEEALTHFAAAGALADELDDLGLRGRALRGLGGAHRGAGRHAAAAACLGEALRISVATRDHGQEISCLLRLGRTSRDRGRLDEAAGYLERALGVIGEHSDRRKPYALHYLAAVELGRQRHDAAERLCRDAIHAADELGDVRGRVSAARVLADTYRATGQLDAAAALLDQVLSTVEALGEDVGLAQTLRRLGEVYRDLGRHREALDYLDRAVDIARAVGTATLRPRRC